MDKITCYSCNKSKHKLNVKMSSILPISLLMCESCINSKYEPRWTIILAGRQNGPESVREFILKKRYVGNDISAFELIV
jgi:hypothetical protein